MEARLILSELKTEAMKMLDSYKVKLFNYSVPYSSTENGHLGYFQGFIHRISRAEVSTLKNAKLYKIGVECVEFM